MSAAGTPTGSRAAIALAIALMLGTSLACATPSQKKVAAIYGPTESILEVVAVLRRHVPDDTYRFPPATDFTGRNVYRASLMRLENLELLHHDALRAGHLDAVIGFSKGRSLERVRAYDLAAQHYRKVAEQPGTLQNEARRSAWMCEELGAATSIGIHAVDPLAGSEESGSPPALSLDYERIVAGLDSRIAVLSDLLDRIEVGDAGRHYIAVVREEIEVADRVRAAYFVAMRNALPEGSIRAVGELQRVVARHSPSKLRRRHILALADFYALLASDYVIAHPPEGLRFDPPRFEELVDAASRLYQSVATQDGAPEKLEAARRFEAFLAFTLQVDRDRFSQ